MVEQVTTVEKKRFFMFRVDVKGDVNVLSKAAFNRFIDIVRRKKHAGIF